MLEPNASSSRSRRNVIFCLSRQVEVSGSLVRRIEGIQIIQRGTGCPMPQIPQAGRGESHGSGAEPSAVVAHSSNDAVTGTRISAFGFRSHSRRSSEERGEISARAELSAPRSIELPNQIGRHEEHESARQNAQKFGRMLSQRNSTRFSEHLTLIRSLAEPDGNAAPT